MTDIPTITQEEAVEVRALKPCPFCGAEATRSNYQTESLWSHDTVTYTQVGCDECDYSFASEPGYELEAPDRWNTRAALCPNMDHAVGGVRVTPEIDRALRSSLMRSHTLVEVLPSVTPPVNQDAVREAVAGIIDPSAWRDQGYSWAQWRIDQSLSKADAILALATPPLVNTGLDAATVELKHVATLLLWQYRTDATALPYATEMWKALDAAIRALASGDRS